LLKNQQQPCFHLSRYSARYVDDRLGLQQQAMSFWIHNRGNIIKGTCPFSNCFVNDNIFVNFRDNEGDYNFRTGYLKSNGVNYGNSLLFKAVELLDLRTIYY
jgi:hypothetical protein